MNNITTNSDYKDTFTAWMSVIPGLCSLQQDFRAETNTSLNNLYVPVLISCLRNVEEDLRMHRLARQQDTVINNDCVKETSWIKNHTELSTHYCLFESGYVYSTPHPVHIKDSRKKVTLIFLIHCHIQKIGTNTPEGSMDQNTGLGICMMEIHSFIMLMSGRYETAWQPELWFLSNLYHRLTGVYQCFGGTCLPCH